MIEKKIALLIETRPDAIGLNFFEGCCLSLSISIESLTKSIELEIRQKDIKHTKEEIQTSNICEKEKNGAAKTIRFLVHCFGLHANNRYFKLCS